MKLPPATLLIIAMFGSFVIILAIMIAIFRPESPPRRLVKQTRAMPVDTLKHEPKPTVDTLSLADTVRQTPETLPPRAASRQTKAPIPRTAEEGRRLYRELEREQKEMAALRADMERRLKKAQREQVQHLAQLARRCEPLEPGEAVQILIGLRDADIATVLRHMKPEKAAPIMALLKRLGREKAIANKQ